MMAPASYAGEPERGPMSTLSSCSWLEIAMDFMIHRLLQHRSRAQDVTAPDVQCCACAVNVEG